MPIVRLLYGGIFPTAPTYTGILDTYPGATVGYSVRRLRGGYNGPLVRVRRSSDNAEEDIGPSTVSDVNGNYFLDETALLSFVGANDGFVTIRYDQGVNGFNETQGVTTRQGKIVTAGATITQGGKPTIEFNGTNTWYQYTGETFSSIAGAAGFFVHYLGTIASNGRAMHQISGGTGALSRFLAGANVGAGSQITAAARRLDGDTAVFARNLGLSVGFYQSAHRVDYTNGILALNVNNNVGVTTAISTGVSDSIPAVFTGSGSTGGVGNYYLGTISESIIYKDAMTAAVSAISANQITAFTVV